MLNYKQSIFEIQLQYIKDKIQCEKSLFSGERIEDKGSIKTHNCENLLDLEQLQYGSADLLKSNKLVELVKKSLEKFTIEFSVVLNMHYEKILFNNEKEDDRSYKFLRFILKKESNMQLLDFPIQDRFYDRIEEICQKVNNTELRQVSETYNHINFTEMPHVFSPQATGYFIHEIIGHILESDYFFYYKNKYNNILIPPKLVVIDSVEGYDNIIGKFKYDDNGIATKPLTLISEGKINNIMAVQSCDSFDKKLYGCARRASYKTEILPRMKNTYILPVDNFDQEEIVSKYIEGIFIKEIHSGRVNHQTGNYFLNGNGYLIRNGMLQNFIGNMKICGNILRDIGLIEYIGKDLEIYGNYCVKFNQSLRVGCGGPTISISSLNSTGVVYGRR